MKSSGGFDIEFDRPVLHNNMIWLPVNVTECLKGIHDGLDELLESKYSVPLTAYDTDFKPHISLFTKGDRMEMAVMHELLVKELAPMTMRVQRIVIGGTVHRDTYYTI